MGGAGPDGRPARTDTPTVSREATLLKPPGWSSPPPPATVCVDRECDTRWEPRGVGSGEVGRAVARGSGECSEPRLPSLPSRPTRPAACSLDSALISDPSVASRSLAGPQGDRVGSSPDGDGLGPSLAVGAREGLSRPSHVPTLEPLRQEVSHARTGARPPASGVLALDRAMPARTQPPLATGLERGRRSGEGSRPGLGAEPERDGRGRAARAPGTLLPLFPLRASSISSMSSPLCSHRTTSKGRPAHAAKPKE